VHILEQQRPLSLPETFPDRKDKLSCVAETNIEVLNCGLTSPNARANHLGVQEALVIFLKTLPRRHENVVTKREAYPFFFSRFRYEQKLAQERDVGLRLKGENGILKKKASAFQKDLEDQKDEIKELFEKKKDLYQTIASLEKDIASLKKEIRERDETIGDKEKRIYDLKKKNQVRVRVKKA
jgi:predicted RNase H-like nuclease (RuvC/YqgF family)